MATITRNWTPARFWGMWIMSENEAELKLAELLKRAQDAINESQRILEARKRAKQNEAAAIF